MDVLQDIIAAITEALLITGTSFGLGYAILKIRKEPVTEYFIIGITIFNGLAFILLPIMSSYYSLSSLFGGILGTLGALLTLRRIAKKRI